MRKKCQMPNCKNEAKILKIESKIQNGINLNKIIFNFCKSHTDEEIKKYMSEKCQEKSDKTQAINPFLDAKKLIQ